MTGAPTGWIKLLCKRYAFSCRVKRICKAKNITIEPNGTLWWLGTNKSGKHNFTVTVGETRYSVKLVGVRNSAILFGFVSPTVYELKDYTFVLPNAMDGVTYALKEKEPYRFPRGTVPCIVMVPDSAKVTVRRRTEQRDRQEIGSGDQTPEGTFFLAPKFLQMLKEK